jgi:adenosylhomocysteine nucleosidase
MTPALRLLSALSIALLLISCRAPERRPIVVQGAMDVEVRTLAGALTGVSEERVQGWTFWHGTLDGYPVIVSKTLKGLAGAAAATAIAAERYHPIAIVNQGTAGGHEASLRVYDIVVGTHAVNLGSFKTGFRPAGRGSDLIEWMPLDLTRSDGSAGNDPNARRMRRFEADGPLLAAALSVKDRYTRGRVVEGVIGSAETWNSELDRIKQFHDQYGTSVEEMETVAAAQIADLFHIPFLGIRVVSNNITNDGAYDGKTAAACQEYVSEVVKAYIKGLSQVGQVGQVGRAGQVGQSLPRRSSPVSDERRRDRP